MTSLTLCVRRRARRIPKTHMLMSHFYDSQKMALIFINFACNKDPQGSYAKMAFASLVKEGSECQKEVVKNLDNFKFPGPGAEIN